MLAPPNKSEWRQWYKPFNTEIVPIAPFGATLTPGTTIREAHLGKVPGVRTAAGTWSGLSGKWSDDHSTTMAMAKQYDKWGASIGMQGRKFPGLDIDVDDAVLSDAIQSLAEDYFGLAPVRTRPGSARRLMMYRTDAPLRKVRQEFGDHQAVELLCKGQQYVVVGGNPECQWLGENPCDLGPDGLALITPADVERFFGALGGLLERHGQTLGKAVAGTATLTTGTRKSLDDTSLHAPGGPEAVVALLKVWRPEEMAHDEFVEAGAAIKAALGPTREDFFSDFLEWAPGARSQEYDETRKRWDSFTDAALGWDYLLAVAGVDTAQAAFDDDLGAAIMDAPQPNNVLESMLARYVYSIGQDRYYDSETGAPLTPKAFNSCNTAVARFGLSGVQSAEGVFQNTPKARKVATVTYRPGKPAIVQEEINGVLQNAVNLYRPSRLIPTKGADVQPWLDHVTLLFGEPGDPAREHFLNYLAFVLQHPGVKINHAIVLLGRHGIGKDTVLVPLTRGLGAHNYSTVKPETLLGQFTHFLEGQLIVVEEMMSFSKRENYNKMKEWLASPPERLEVNRKHMNPYSIPNIQVWVFLTNHEDAIALEDGDRRFWVHNCEIEVPESERYFGRLYDWLNAGGDAACVGWLLDRDVSKFNPCAPPPMTKAKRAMLDTAQPAPVRWLRDQFSDGGAFAARTVMTVGELLATEDFSAPVGINVRHATAVLKLEGFRPAQRLRIRQGDDPQQLWARDPSGLIGQLPPDKLRDRYIAETSPTKSAGAVA
jgi:hypothetical protein